MHNILVFLLLGSAYVILPADAQGTLKRCQWTGRCSVADKMVIARLAPSSDAGARSVAKAYIRKLWCRDASSETDCQRYPGGQCLWDKVARMCTPNPGAEHAFNSLNYLLCPDSRAYDFLKCFNKPGTEQLCRNSTYGDGCAWITTGGKSVCVPSDMTDRDLQGLVALKDRLQESVLAAEYRPDLFGCCANYLQSISQWACSNDKKRRECTLTRFCTPLKDSSSGTTSCVIERSKYFQAMLPQATFALLSGDIKACAAAGSQSLCDRVALPSGVAMPTRERLVTVMTAKDINPKECPKTFRP